MRLSLSFLYFAPFIVIFHKMFFIFDEKYAIMYMEPRKMASSTAERKKEYEDHGNRQTNDGARFFARDG